MSTIVTRAGKGSPLTHNEVDANFVNLNTDKAEVGSANTFTAAQTISNQLNLTNASNYNLYASGAGANYMAGSLNIGSLVVAGINVNINKNLTGATQSFNVYSAPQIQSDVTVLTSNYLSVPATQATTFTLTNLRHYDCASVTIGSTSAVTTQVGYYSRALTGATNNYAFQGVVAAATGRYNLYMSGTADNYLAGSLGIGGLPTTGINLRIAGNSTGITTIYGIQQSQAIQSDVTVAAYINHTAPSTQAASFTLSALYHYSAAQGTIGATSAVTSQYGYIANSSLTGATNDYGFFGNIAAATGRYNLYMSGTADNYLAGQLLVGTTTATNGYTALSPIQSTNQYQVSIGGTNTFAGSPYGLFINAALTGTTASTGAAGIFLSSVFAVPASGTINSLTGITSSTTFNTTSTTTTYSGYVATLTFGAAAIGNTLTNAYAFNANGPTINAATTTAITNAAQFNAANIAGTAGSVITLATAFRGRQASTNTGVTGNWNLYMDGTANNYLAGGLGIGSTSLTDRNLAIAKTITGATIAYAVLQNGTVQSDVTATAYGFRNSAATVASAFTLSSYVHFQVVQGTIGSTSAVTNQYGFLVDATATGATNNYAFQGSIAAATGRYNLYMGGTAANYLAGTLGVGILPTSTWSVDSQNDGNGDRGIRTINASTGAGAIAMFQTSNGTTTASFGMAGTSYTSYAQIRANGLSIYTGSAAGMGFSADNAAGYITFGTGTAAPERLRIDASGNVGIGATANASAILDVQSTTKGVRMPNMTTTQKNAISSPAAGLMIFDTTLSKLCVYTGAAWQTITSV